MASDLNVSPEQLQAIATQLRSGGSELESLLAHLESVVSSLLEGWTGSAQSQFDDLWATWRRDASKLNESLVDLAQLASRAAEAYASAESTIAGTLRGG